MIRKLTEHIEVLRERYGTRYVLWHVLINPQEKLYPVHWKWNEGTFDTKVVAEISAKCKFPNLKIRLFGILVKPKPVSLYKV